MELNNPLYKGQGIHVISTIFTIENGIVKVLLVKRSNEPYKDMWALVGGALYNNETILDGLNREIYEKTGIQDIPVYFSGIFDDLNRSHFMRMIAISYIGLIDSARVAILNKTKKTSDSDWVPIDKIPKLAYDHNKILKQSLETLKDVIIKTDILKALFPNGFTIPEVQKVYETVLNEKFERRNFRKKLLSMDFVVDTNKTRNFEGNKPAKVYEFKK